MDGTPFIQISTEFPGGYRYAWYAHFTRPKVQLRLVGERFWVEVPEYGSERPFAEGGPVEINVESWEYPELYVGRREETAIFDPTGIDWAEQQVDRCEAA